MPARRVPPDLFPGLRSLLDFFAFSIAISHKAGRCCKQPGRRRGMRGRSVAEGGMLALRAACLVWVVVIAAIVLLPGPDFGGLDVGSPTVQGISFAAGAVLFALADRERPAFFGWAQDPARPLRYFVIRFKRHLIRIAAMLICYAAVLELGRSFAVEHRFRLMPLAQNISWILLACAVLYALTRLILVKRELSRITRCHLRRASAALRSEMAYSAYLRDTSQAAYAVCVAPSIAAEDKVDRIRRMLDKVLGAQLPNYGEDLLDTVFGLRQASPTRYRPAPVGDGSGLDGDEAR